MRALLSVTDMQPIYIYIYIYIPHVCFMLHVYCLDCIQDVQLVYILYSILIHYGCTHNNNVHLEKSDILCLF